MFSFELFLKCTAVNLGLPAAPEARLGRTVHRGQSFWLLWSSSSESQWWRVLFLIAVWPRSSSFQKVKGVTYVVGIRAIQKLDKKSKAFLFSLTEKKYSEKATDTHASHSSSPELPPSGVKGASGSAVGLGELGSAQCPAAGARTHDFEYTAKIRTLAETERFFDELTKEKDQVKATKNGLPLFLNLRLVAKV